MTLRARWKKHVNLAINLDTEHVKSVKDLERPEDVYTKVYMPFSSLMTELLESSNIEELTQCMFAHMKTKWTTFKCLQVVLH